MESPEAQVRYHVSAKVVNIVWRNQPDGWFVHFDGSRESLNFGIERPPWDIDDVIHITFEKVSNALPR